MELRNNLESQTTTSRNCRIQLSSLSYLISTAVAGFFRLLGDGHIGNKSTSRDISALRPTVYCQQLKIPQLPTTKRSDYASFVPPLATTLQYESGPRPRPSMLTELTQSVGWWPPISARTSDTTRPNRHSDPPYPRREASHRRGTAIGVDGKSPL